MRRRYKGDPAFLAACQTVDNPNTSLVDEGIHIASAFQVARFTHVVGTMWSFMWQKNLINCFFGLTIVFSIALLLELGMGHSSTEETPSQTW